MDIFRAGCYTIHTYIIKEKRHANCGKINQLRLRHMMKLSDLSQTAAIAVSIEFFGVSNFYGINELDDFRSKNTFKESVYAFSAKIGAAAVDVADGQFILFASKTQIEAESQSYTRFPLSEELLASDNVRRVFASVGLGADARTSQMNALFALQKSRDLQKSCVYIAYTKNRFAGPVPIERKTPAKTETGQLQKRLSVIAGSTGLSFHALQKLQAALARHAVDTVTCTELSALMELGRRAA